MTNKFPHCVHCGREMYHGGYNSNIYTCECGAQYRVSDSGFELCNKMWNSHEFHKKFENRADAERILPPPLTTIRIEERQLVWQGSLRYSMVRAGNVQYWVFAEEMPFARSKGKRYDVWIKNLGIGDKVVIKEERGQTWSLSTVEDVWRSLRMIRVDGKLYEFSHGTVNLGSLPEGVYYRLFEPVPKLMKYIEDES